MSIGPKQALYSEFATVARALGSQHRLEILEHLAQGERGVEALAQRVGLSVANASQHLQQLRRAALVASRRDGRSIIYSAAYDRMRELLAFLMEDCCAGNPLICGPLAEVAARPCAAEGQSC